MPTPHRGGGFSRHLPAAVLLTIAATTAPATQPALWAEMRQVDAAAATAGSITADFRQEKFTPLLRRPLVSTGRVVARGDTSLWSTAAPRASTMHVAADRLELYYPDQKLVEQYPLAGQLAAMAATPLPRLDALAKFFAFAKLPGSGADVLMLELTPATDDLRQHVRTVRVTLDRRTGGIRRAETTDADGGRTVLTFDHVDLHARVTDADLALTIPPDARVTHPLAGLTPPAR